MGHQIQCDIAKCCPPEQSYDHNARLCTNHVSDNHNKSFFHKDAVLFKNIVPDCSEDEVFVEYLSTIHTIEFDGMTLRVDGKTLSSDKFCIEDLVHTNVSGTNGSENHVIVRSCRPRSLCNEIPCMRRCCRVDQIIVLQPGGSKVCLTHPNKTNLVPIFHDVSLSLNNPRRTNLKGTYWFCDLFIY